MKNKIIKIKAKVKKFPPKNKKSKNLLFFALLYKKIKRHK
jgi:hypothetical protein